MVAVDGKVYLFGGTTSNLKSTVGPDHLRDSAELWRFDPDASSWSLLPSSPHMARHAAALSAHRKQLWLFGGARMSAPKDDEEAATTASLHHLWSYDVDVPRGWIRVLATGSPPKGLQYSAVALFPGTSKLIFTGGAVCNSGCKTVDDTHSLDVGGSAPFVWRRLSLGPRPASRYRHTLVAMEEDADDKDEGSIMAILAGWLRFVLCFEDIPMRSVYLFGGESYHPSYTYQNDVAVLWRPQGKHGDDQDR